MNLESKETPFYFYNGILEPWFSMGYDGLAGTVKQQPYSLFYSDYNPISQSHDFHEEIRTVLRDLNKRYGKITILDNHGFRANYLKVILSEENLEFDTISTEAVSDRHRGEIQNSLRRYDIDSPLFLHWACAAEEVGGPLLIPNLEIRIVNANYSRLKQDVLGENYFVHIFNERNYLFMKYLEERNKIAFSQLLMAKASLFRAFFFAKQNQEWLKKNKQESPHNHGAEKDLFCDYLDSITKEEGSWHLPASENFRDQTQYQQSSAPLNRLWKKTFLVKESLNQEAERLYGKIY